MGRILHLQYELDYLITRSDGELARMLKGGTPLEMRTQLVIDWAKGRRYLVAGKCDQVGPDGGCQGHHSPDHVAPAGEEGMDRISHRRGTGLHADGDRQTQPRAWHDHRAKTSDQASEQQNR